MAPATTTQLVNLSAIKVPERMREIDQEHVKTLRASIAKRGLLQALWVREVAKGEYKLLAGAHRLEAIKGLDPVPTTVKCEVWARVGSDAELEDEDQLAEIIENLLHLPLTQGQRDLQTYLAAEIETSPLYSP